MSSPGRILRGKAERPFPAVCRQEKGRSDPVRIFPEDHGSRVGAVSYQSRRFRIRIVSAAPNSRIAVPPAR